MELNALGGQLAMPNGHHDAVEAGAQLEARGQVARGDQRVVPADGERLRQADEDRPPVVLDDRLLAVARVPLEHLAAEGLDHRLVTEADA